MSTIRICIDYYIENKLCIANTEPSCTFYLTESDDKSLVNNQQLIQDSFRICDRKEG